MSAADIAAVRRVCAAVTFPCVPASLPVLPSTASTAAFVAAIFAVTAAALSLMWMSGRSAPSSRASSFV